jgi:hypothetical protein
VRRISRTLIVVHCSEPMFLGTSENAASLAGRLYSLGGRPSVRVRGSKRREWPIYEVAYPPGPKKAAVRNPGMRRNAQPKPTTLKRLSTLLAGGSVLTWAPW